MELENIVANTVLMKAKESTRDGRGRSRKWRTMLQFSEPSECEDVRQNLEMSYQNIVEQQPIGEKLFEEFCMEDNLLGVCWDFIRRLEDYRALPNEKLKYRARELFEEFLLPTSKPEPPVSPTVPESVLKDSETLSNSVAEAGATPSLQSHSLLEVFRLVPQMQLRINIHCIIEQNEILMQYSAVILTCLYIKRCCTSKYKHIENE